MSRRSWAQTVLVSQPSCPRTMSFNVKQTGSSVAVEFDQLTDLDRDWQRHDRVVEQNVYSARTYTQEITVAPAMQV